MADKVDAILLDSGNQKLAVKELGGTGRTHDWRVSRKIVVSDARAGVSRAVLNPDNVADAIQQVRPFGVDILQQRARRGSWMSRGFNGLWKRDRSVGMK